MLFTLLLTMVQNLPIHCSALPESVKQRNAVEEVLRDTYKALGSGWETMNGITINSSKIYRSHTLGQGYDIWLSDQSVASAGTQSRSFTFSDDKLQSRIDRTYSYDDYWIWAHPDLRPTMNYSLVIRDGSQGYACFNKGQNAFYVDNPSSALGYTDAYLTDYLQHQAHQFALPWLIEAFLEDSAIVHLSREQDTFSQVTYTVLEHPGYGLRLFLDSDTYLPQLVRSREDNTVFGNSFSDVLFTEWTQFPTMENGSIYFPRRLQTVYNSRAVLEDFLIDRISINPDFPVDFFDPQPPARSTANSQSQIASRPAHSTEYPRSEVHEMFESGLWAGPLPASFNTSAVVVDHPIPTFPQVRSVYIGYVDYIQLLIELESGLIVTDAPAHRSKILLDWVKHNMPDKNITHVVPSHHHRDHAAGVIDYVNAGATLVVPEVARAFYELTIPGEKITTYTPEEPFVLKDDCVEFRSFHAAHAPHALDWSWCVAAKRVDSANLVDDESEEENAFVAFVADVINPGHEEALKWDTGAAREFFIQAVRAGLPRSAVVVGAHGSSKNGTSTADSLRRLAEQGGFVYPALTGADWENAGEK